MDGHNSEYLHVVHPFGPLYNEDSKVLILGSIPSPASREVGFYYGHPRNRFWRVLAGVFGEPAPCGISEKKQFLLRNHIALWDVLASCEITGSADASIKNAEPNQIDTILRQAKIERIFVNGKTAQKYYLKYLYHVTGVDAVCLPSTSPANARMREEELIKIWNDLLCQ